MSDRKARASSGVTATNGCGRAAAVLISMLRRAAQAQLRCCTTVSPRGGSEVRRVHGQIARVPDRERPDSGLRPLHNAEFLWPTLGVEETGQELGRVAVGEELTTRDTLWEIVYGERGFALVDLLLALFL